MFTTLLVQPIFNVLVAIYAIIPGHNFGVAIILFTILVRLLMWPLVKKQLHHAKAMRELQPELKKIKKAAGGDRRKESMMQMELYKEKEIKPFASIGLLLIQLPIFIALYSALNRLIQDPSTLITFTYSFIQNLSWIQEVGADISKFDNSLFGLIDLSRPALGDTGFYLPAFVIVALSAVTQYFQGRQLMRSNKDAKKLRDILKEASEGRQADQCEMAAATGRFTQFMIPSFVFIFTVGLPSALPLYWLTTSLTALFQQSKILGQDQQELKSIAKATGPKGEAIEGEVIPSKKPKSKKKSSKKSKKRRR